MDTNDKVCVLISCMYKNNIKIIQESNIEENAIIVNQTNVGDEEIIKYPNKIILINSPTRGLSVSRNIAIKHSSSDICILSDDDEIFVNNCQELIKEQYRKFKKADIIIFKIKNKQCKLKDKVYKLSFFDLLKVSSWQISFRRKSIVNKGISFDTNLGSGTPNGGGEENKFLLDCYKNKLNIYFVPEIIAEIKDSNSQWFFGYNKEYFYNRGASTRYIYGFCFSLLYSFYYVLSHQKKFSSSISPLLALYYSIIGIIENRISKSKR